MIANASEPTVDDPGANRISPLGPLIGWVLASGAVAFAGFCLGVVEGDPRESSLFAGGCLLLVSGGAVLLGGHAAARIAPAHRTIDGGLVWLIAISRPISVLTIFAGVSLLGALSAVPSARPQRQGSPRTPDTFDGRTRRSKPR